MHGILDTDGSDPVSKLTYVNNQGKTIPLFLSDIVISHNARFCQVIQMYTNDTILVRHLGEQVAHRLHTSQIMINLSYVSPQEQDYTKMKNEREAWQPGRPVEVFSKSASNWCIGYIIKPLVVRSDERIAHGDVWFQVVYFIEKSGKVKYKQAKADHSDVLCDAKQGSRSDPELWVKFHELLAKQEPRYLHPSILARMTPQKRTAENSINKQNGVQDNIFSSKATVHRNTDVKTNKNQGSSDKFGESLQAGDRETNELPGKRAKKKL